jgi:choice-of-anchor C domain-containing protein
VARFNWLGSLVGLAAILPTEAFAAPILINGSFELGPPPFGIHDIDIQSGSTSITGWMVTGAGVDLLEDPWAVSDGVRAIDLDGRSAGGIQQTFATVIGQLYRVSFDLSGNPEGGPTSKRIRVTASGVSQDYAFDTTGQTLDSLTWAPSLFVFVATDISSTLAGVLRP